MPRRALQRGSSEAIHALWDRLADQPVSQVDAALAELKRALCAWLDADGTFWVGAVRLASGATGRRDPLHGWRARVVQHLRADVRARARVRQAMRDQDDGGPPMTSRALAAGAGAFRVRTLHDGLVDLDAFRRTAHYRDFFETLGVQDRMWIVAPVNADAESYFVLDRVRSRRRFSAADAELAGYALRGLKWFHRQLMMSHGLPVAREPLSPAERRVLLLLLEGLPKKSVAQRLGLAGGTIHQYAATVYRKLGVKGRAELAALWLGR